MRRVSSDSISFEFLHSISSRSRGKDRIFEERSSLLALTIILNEAEIKQVKQGQNKSKDVIEDNLFRTAQQPCPFDSLFCERMSQAKSIE